jgi:hypothetical protein
MLLEDDRGLRYGVLAENNQRLRPGEGLESVEVLPVWLVFGGVQRHELVSGSKSVLNPLR